MQTMAFRVLHDVTKLGARCGDVLIVGDYQRVTMQRDLPSGTVYKLPDLLKKGRMQPYAQDGSDPDVKRKWMRKLKAAVAAEHEIDTRIQESVKVEVPAEGTTELTLVT